MNKRLFFSLSAVVLSAAVGIGATFALFSDTISDSATLTSGILCIDSVRDQGDTVPGPMFYMTAEQGQTPDGALGLWPTGELETPGGWAPGDEVTRTLTVLPCPNGMEAKLVAVSAALEPGSHPPLADWFHVIVRAQVPGSGLIDVAQAPLNDFLSGIVPMTTHPHLPAWTPGAVLQPNIHMEFEVQFDRDASDVDLQGKDLIVTFTVHAEQYRNN